MTAMLFSREATSIDPNIDADFLEDLIAREEKRLKLMHLEFIGEYSLCHLQLKLINALKSLLSLLNKSHSIEEFMFQVSKISALYHEIDSEFSKAKNKDDIRLEILANEQRMKEIILLITQSFERAYRHSLLHEAWRLSQKFKEQWNDLKIAKKEIKKYLQQMGVYGYELRNWRERLAILDNKKRPLPKPKPGYN